MSKIDIQLPYAFHELRLPMRFKAFYGGRGGAKSHSIGAALILRGYERRALRWLCAREVQKSLDTSVKKLLEDKIRLAGLGPTSDGGNGFYKITDRTIKSQDGRVEFIFAGLKTNPDSVKSTEGLDGAWVEEADMASQRSIDLLLPTVRKPGSELWFSWNPKHVKDPVYKMFVGGRPPPNSFVRKVTYADNPWFPDVLKDQLEWDKARDLDKYLHVWEGFPVVHSEARVFRNWETKDLDDWVLENDVPRLGADWGFSIDPTVLVEAYVISRQGHRDILYVKDERYKLKCSIDETPSLFAGDDVRERWKNPNKNPGLEAVRRGYKIVADSARPETIRHLKDRGFNIVAAIKGARSVEEGVEFINSMDMFIHPRCRNVIAEVSVYSYKEDPLTNEVLPVLKDKDNHTIDALRYALEGVRRVRKQQPPTVAPIIINTSSY